jgi:ribokinase
MGAPHPRTRSGDGIRVAVVGHVEWCTFAPVDHVPEPGEIVEAPEALEMAAGGGAVAAVQMARLAGECALFTALGDDEWGRRVAPDLEARGVRVKAVTRPAPQRRAFVHLAEDGERTITTMGERPEPRGGDPLPWNSLDGFDAVYFTAGDDEALGAARAARVLVATIRARGALHEAGVRLDALAASARDAGERFEPGDVEPPPEVVVRTEGTAGGTFEHADGSAGRWEAAEPPGPVVDTYGAGDSFAGALTYGLGRGLGIEAALELAARLGAASVTGRGPYEGQRQGSKVRR